MTTIRAETEENILGLATRALGMIDHVNAVRIESDVPITRLVAKSLDNPKWPQAVPDKLICRTKSDRQRRAQEVATTFVASDLKSKRVLDYGCGDGLVAQALTSLGPAHVVAYDALAVHDGVCRNWEEAIGRGPYDYVLLYDVLDHLVALSPEEALRQVASALAPGGVVQARCHPWCSRHGTHLPRDINRAFAHLVHPPEVFSRRGVEQTPTIKVTMPLATYEKWFVAGGFTIASQRIIRHEVEQYVIDNFREEIAAHWADHAVWLRGDMFFPTPQLEIEYVDYVLRQA